MSKSDAIVQNVYAWVMKEYDEGRITMISDEELEEQLKKYL